MSKIKSEPKHYYTESKLTPPTLETETYVNIVQRPSSMKKICQILAVKTSLGIAAAEFFTGVRALAHSSEGTLLVNN